MKYTSLFSAVAIAAAMGTQALATVTTNAVGTVQDFEGADPIASRTGWTVQTEDQSEIIAAPLSSADAVAGYTANQHLKLNTEGQELVWRPGTVSEPKSIIEMKVRLVASDTAPAISAEDSTVHAAVYLQVSEPVDATNDGLYAYTTTNSQDGCWQKLNAPFNAQLATGSMIALRVLMDYEHQTASYEGCLLADAENDVPVYVNLGTLDMANPDVTVTALTSVGFKGTGGVDDLFVKELHETPSTATVNFELWDGGVEAADDDTDTLDTVESGSSAGTAFTIQSGLVVKSVELFENGTQLQWTLEPTVDAQGNIEVSMANYTFVAEHTYLVKVTVGEETQEWTVTFDNNGHGTAPTAQTVEDGAKATEPTAPTAEGWVFKGWMLNGAAYDFNSTVSADITLVASWKQLFTVTFDVNGHGTAPAVQQVEDGATASEPTAPTAEGYTFNGWKLGGNDYSFATPVTASITLVADWSEASSAEGVEFGTFAIVDGTAQFTAFSVSGTTATATLSANIESTGTQTQKTLYAKYETALGSGSYGYAEATVTAQTAGTPGSVTFTFTVPAGNAVFLRGLSNENGSN